MRVPSLTWWKLFIGWASLGPPHRRTKAVQRMAALPHH